MSSTDELVRNAEIHAAGFSAGDLPVPPARRVAVVTCMDARLNPYAILGLKEGDAHILRNAGGAVTDDVVRSLAVSQRLLGTEEIVLILHTDCGMRTFTHDAFVRQVEADTGARPTWAAEIFTDPAGDVRQFMARIEASPFLPNKSVRGFVYDVHTGRLDEVSPA